MPKIDPDEAHARLRHDADLPDNAHYTFSRSIPSILGTQVPGLVPGGPANRRGAVHASNVISVDGSVPNKARKRGIDCQVIIDTKRLIQDGIAVYVTDADTVLIYDTVPVKYIVRVVMLTSPQLTLYRRPMLYDVAAAKADTVACRQCYREHRLGMWYCEQCWSALTVGAIQDRQVLIVHPHEKARELAERYNLTAKTFHALTAVPGASVNAIPVEHFVRGADVPAPTFSDAWVGKSRGIVASAAAPASSAAPAAPAVSWAPRGLSTQVEAPQEYRPVGIAGIPSLS